MQGFRFVARPRIGSGADGVGQRAMRHLVGLLFLVGMLTVASRPAAAQNTGSIFGTVQDSTGAVIPNADVTAQNGATGAARSVKSNASGEFLLSGLPVGVYTLTVNSPQFEIFAVNGITVDANASIKEQVSMKTGSANETVTVQDSSSSAIDANSPTLGTLIDTKLIEDLPIDGHNAVALSALLPGVVDVNAPTTFTGDTKGPTYSASGSRTTQNLMLFDGLMWNNLFYNTGINYPPPNALQEVSVLLNNYKAEYGRNAGSVFNVITKAGSNSFHGTVWDYIQNQYFNASDYISKVNPKDNINQWGFTAQGPIRKDKLFFAGAFQGLIGHLQNTGSIIPVGLAERGLLPNGQARPCTSPGPYTGMNCASFVSEVSTTTGWNKFVNPLDVTGSSNGASETDTDNMLTSGYQQAGGKGTSPCIDLLRQAQPWMTNNNYIYPGVPNSSGKVNQQLTYMPYAEVPTQCLNPVMLNMFKAFVPTVVSPGQTLATTASPLPESDKNALARIDYTLNGHHSFDARYNMISSTAQSPAGLNSASQGVANYEVLNGAGKSNFGNVGWTWVMSPNLLNVARVGYKRYESTQFPMDPRTLNSVDFGGNFVETGLPALPAISLGSSVFSLGSDTQGYQGHVNENVELNESLSWTRGNHSIKGGFSFLRLQYMTRADYPGKISFSTTFSGVTVADALMGLANSFQAQNRLIQGGIQHDAFVYLQDDWRATPKLTLNYGLRYELPFQWFQPQGQSATFVPGIQSTVFPTAPGGLGFPGDKNVLPSMVPTDFNGVAPRVGFAYDVTGQGKLLIRGGFGIFFDAVNANVIGVGEPFHFIIFNLIPPGGASVPLATYGPNNTVQTVPGTFDPKNPQFVAPYSIFYPDPNFRTPCVEAVNFGFQYHIPHGGTLETNYVAKLARKLTIPPRPESVDL